MRLKTDREKMTDLLDEWGVHYTEDQGDIVLEARTEKVMGYIGFETLIMFDADGSFLNFDIGE